MMVTKLNITPTNHRFASIATAYFKGQFYKDANILYFGSIKYISKRKGPKTIPIKYKAGASDHLA